MGESKNSETKSAVSDIDSLDDAIEKAKSGRITVKEAYRSYFKTMYGITLNELVKSSATLPEWECTLQNRIIDCLNDGNFDELSKAVYFISRI